MTAFDNSRSEKLFQRALKVLPGGNTRHTIFFAPHPPYAKRAEGVHVWDVDGVKRVDFINNYSSLIHGHKHPEILSVVRQQIEDLIAVGLPTEQEVILAETLAQRLPGSEKFRFCNSGTEAVMFAIKAARAFTGRFKVAKVEGCFHGSYDPSEVSLVAGPENWGPEDAPHSVALNKGTTDEVLSDTIVIPLNDIKTTRSLIEANAEKLAAVIIDPSPSRLSFLDIDPDYLYMLREVTAKHGIVLLFDEVFSFRLGYGGVQGILGIQADLTALGKIIGGGFSVGAVGGSNEVMSVFDFPKEGIPGLVQGGTFNANPVTMAAGRAALNLLDKQKIELLEQNGALLRSLLSKALKDTGVPGQVYGRGSLTGLRFAPKRATNFREYVLDGCNAHLTVFLHRHLLDEGFLTTQTGLFIGSSIMTEDHIYAVTEAVTDGINKWKDCHV